MKYKSIVVYTACNASNVNLPECEEHEDEYDGDVDEYDEGEEAVRYGGHGSVAVPRRRDQVVVRRDRAVHIVRVVAHWTVAGTLRPGRCCDSKYVMSGVKLKLIRLRLSS